MNKRLLILMASLLLCGAVSAQTHFEVNTHAQDNNMPVVAQVVLDGDTVTTGGYELGAFIGDEVRGSAQIQPSLDNTYWIQVYYSTDDEATATVSFKLYDGEDEYTAETTLTIDPEGVGTPGTPQVIEFASTSEQTVVLLSGENWVSFNVGITLDELKEALVEAVPDASIVIKSQGGSMTYNPLRDRWIGSIDWDLTSSYRIEVPVEGEYEVSLVGMRLNDVGDITIAPGENWIAFPFATSMTLLEAFAGFATNGDVVTNQQGSSTYNSTRQRWIGSVSNLEPGKGYLYNSTSTETRTFTFPQPSR